MVEAIASHRADFIKFSADQELQKVKAEFFEIEGCLNVVAIDCTHIKIKSLGSDHPFVYVNRKGFCSLNVQVVCGPFGVVAHTIQGFGTIAT